MFFLLGSFLLLIYSPVVVFILIACPRNHQVNQSVDQSITNVSLFGFVFVCLCHYLRFCVMLFQVTEVRFDGQAGKGVFVNG